MWSNWLWRLIFVAIVAVVLFWALPAIVALLVAIIPPMAHIAGAVTIVIEAVLILVLVWWLFGGRIPPVTP